MRVADKMLYDQVQGALVDNRSKMSKLQNQAVTLKRVTKPSDDPLAATRVLTFRTEEQANDQFLKTSAHARSILDFADQSLAEMSEVLIRAKELVLSQASDAGSSKQSRRLVAQEIEQLFQQTIQIGNRKLGERYLFGGYNTTSTPFDFKGNYKGDDGEVLMAINKDAHIAVNIPGSKIFLGKKNLDHEDGTEKIVKPMDSQELQKATEHHQKIQAQKAENKENGQELSENGQVHVRGPASIRSVDEETKNLEGVEKEAAGFGLSGTSQLKGINIFNLLKGVEISLRANDKFGLQDSLDELDEALSQVVLARSELGARTSTLEANMSSIEKNNIDIAGSASTLEDVDQFKVVTDINKTEGTLQATLQTAGKLIQPSLLDFLR